MTVTIDNKIIKKAKQLKAEGISKREISSRLKISRHQVDKIFKTDAIPCPQREKNALLITPEKAEKIQTKTSETSFFNFIEAHRIICIGDAIAVTVTDEKGDHVVVVPKTNENYNLFVEAINIQDSQKLHEAIIKVTNPVNVTRNKENTKNQNKEEVSTIVFSGANIDFIDGTISFRNHKIPSNHDVIKNRIDYLCSSDNLDKLIPLLKCIDRIFDNPSYHLVTTGKIFNFLSYADIDIDDEGNFIMYKVVTKDYLDKHTRKILNAPNSIIPPFKRNQVDENCNKLCSFGYHNCSLTYSYSFYDDGDRIIRTLVAPEDIVAIPNDYADSKIRSTTYKPIKDVTDLYIEMLKNDSIDTQGFFKQPQE